MTPQELESELERGRLRPAYLLAGSEPLLRDDAAKAILAVAFGESPREFDLERIDAETASPGQLIEAVRTLPVLAPRRVVWLREPEARRRGPTLDDALSVLVAEVSPRSDVVLLVTAARVDRRARWVKAFKEPAASVDCAAPSNARVLLAFIVAEASRQGVVLEPGAAEALADHTGPQLLALRQEIAKASLHAGGARVSRQDVVATVCDVAEEPIWELTDAIGEGRLPDALAVLGRLQHAGVASPLLLGSLASHFRKLARLRSGARVAGHPFAVRKLERQAMRQSAARLEACLRAIHRADRALKGEGALPPDLALERLVMGLTAPGPADSSLRGG